MKTSELARILGAVDPNLEVAFEVDDGERLMERDAVFGRIEIGPLYVKIHVSLGDAPVYIRTDSVPLKKVGDVDA